MFMDDSYEKLPLSGLSQNPKRLDSLYGIPWVRPPPNKSGIKRDIRGLPSLQGFGYVKACGPQ